MQTHARIGSEDSREEVIPSWLTCMYQGCDYNLWFCAQVTDVLLNRCKGLYYIYDRTIDQKIK